MSSERSACQQGLQPAHCTGCHHLDTCDATGRGAEALLGLRQIVQRVALVGDGEYLYRPMTPFRAIYAVRSGMAKSVALDASGREQVLDFHLPGEWFGLDAIGLDHHENAVISLGRTQFCRFPIDALMALGSREPAVQWHLMQVMARQIRHRQLRSGDHPSDVRMAAFLIDLSDRRAALFLDARHLPLPMQRTDIANHLQLAPETVSRLLTRFRGQGLIGIDRQGVTLLDGVTLRRLGCQVLEAA
ncbi:Crp/Fnr family transcriptional regulator [Dyella sp.]|uniref:Crp/Fnr family transcriptional regulator n=1 Tax=Dyella sp. TaxID=1869338 RepID=UPI002ED5EB79